MPELLKLSDNGQAVTFDGVPVADIFNQLNLRPVQKYYYRPDRGACLWTALAMWRVPADEREAWYANLGKDEWQDPKSLIYDRLDLGNHWAYGLLVESGWNERSQSTKDAQVNLAKKAWEQLTAQG